MLDSDAIARHLHMHSKSGMTHAKYNALYMNGTSRPASIERQASVERPTKRPVSAGQHLVGERPGKGVVGGKDQKENGNQRLSASGERLPANPGQQQGGARVTRSTGLALKKGQGL